MSDDKITILYQIKGIRPCVQKDGYVEVFLYPIDEMKYDNENRESDLPIKVMSTGNPIPPEVMSQMDQFLKALPGFKKQKSEDPRRFLHIESEIDFLARGWKYGDTISVSLEKVEGM